MLELNNPVGPTSKVVSDWYPEGFTRSGNCPTPPGGNGQPDWFVAQNAVCSTIQNGQANTCLGLQAGWGGSGQSGVGYWGPPAVANPTRRCLTHYRPTQGVGSAGTQRSTVIETWTRPVAGSWNWKRDYDNDNVWPGQPDHNPVPSWLPPVIPALKPNHNTPGAPAPTAPPDWALPPLADPDVLPQEWREVGPSPPRPVRVRVETRTLPTPSGPIPWTPGWPWNGKPEPDPAPTRPRTPKPVDPTPVPEPVPQPLPQRETWKTVEFVIDSKGRPSARKDWHTQSKPASSRTVERKLAAVPQALKRIVDALANAVTESADFIEAVHDAICDKGYKGSSKRPDRQLADIYRAARDDKLDLVDAVNNIVKNQLEDAIIGKGMGALAKGYRKAHEAVRGGSNPIGAGTRTRYTKELQKISQDVWKQAGVKAPPSDCSFKQGTRAGIARNISRVL